MKKGPVFLTGKHKKENGMGSAKVRNMTRKEALFIARRHFLIAVVSVVLVSSLSVNRPVSADELSNNAETFIRSMADTAIVRLTEQEISRDERKLRMREMMDEYFFVPGIAQWVLGRFWRQASQEERDEYVSLFEDLMVESYVDRFATYNGETLNIIKTDIRNKKDVIVSSTLSRPETSDSIQIDWRVRSNGSAFKIIDIMVEGVSMGQTQRSEFASSIKNNGGDIAKFLAELRERVTIAASGA